MHVFRTDVPPSIEWRCTSCGDEGVIRGWERSLFDLRPRTTEHHPNGGGVQSVISSDVAATLRGLMLVDSACERLVFRASLSPEGIVLVASEDDLDELLGYVAAEANHEENPSPPEAARCRIPGSQRDGQAGEALVVPRAATRLARWCPQAGVRESAPTRRSALAHLVLVRILVDRATKIRTETLRPYSAFVGVIVAVSSARHPGPMRAASGEAADAPNAGQRRSVAAFIPVVCGHSAKWALVVRREITPRRSTTPAVRTPTHGVGGWRAGPIALVRLLRLTVLRP
jgi:hypothetical protein